MKRFLLIFGALLLVFGALLLGPAAWIWFSLSKAMRPADENVAFEPLARIAVSQLEAGRMAVLTVSASNDPLWHRVRHMLGDPDYAIVVISHKREYRHCLDGLSISVTREHEPVAIEPVGFMYGYSITPQFSSCKSYGMKFRILAGQTAQVHLSLNGDPHLSSETELIVEPIWDLTKDKVVGIKLNNKWNDDLRRMAKSVAVAGLWAIGVALVLLACAIVLPRKQIHESG